jgi:hypothetical protein
MGDTSAAFAAIARQNASPVFLRSLLAAELLPGFAVSEGRQYFARCKLDRSRSNEEGRCPVKLGHYQVERGSTRPRKRISMQRLITSNDEFDRDQDDDDDFQPQRSLGIDNVGQDFGSVGDDLELKRQSLRAFLQFILVFQP